MPRPKKTVTIEEPIVDEIVKEIEEAVEKVEVVEAPVHKVVNLNGRHYHEIKHDNGTTSLEIITE